MIFLLLPLILGVVFLVAAHFVGNWFVNADPRRLARLLRSSGGAMLLVLGVFLVARGQWFLGSALIGTGFSRLSGHRGGLFGGAARGAPTGDQSSTVRTALLEATLDHDTGEIDAMVLAGPHEGQFLSALSDTECLSLWGAAANDEESRLLLEAYLDRRRPEWREDVDGHADRGAGGTGGAGAGRAGPMTEDEAYDILGLAPGASEAEIRAAHRRLMKQMHPDQGGSTFLAAKLNEAKDILLGRR